MAVRCMKTRLRDAKNAAVEGGATVGDRGFS